MGPVTTEAERLRELERQARDAAAIVTRCAFCPDWRYSGTALDGREAALQHRLELHPEAVPVRRPRPGHLHRFRQAPLDAEERALIEFERQRRARAHGVRLR